MSAKERALDVAVGKRARSRRQLVCYLFILPALIPMLALIGVPLVQTIFFSFTNLNDENFDQWTTGLSPSEQKSEECSNAGVVAVEKDSPAAKAGIDGMACVSEINDEKVRNNGALRRLIDKAQRNFLHQGTTQVSVVYRNPGTSDTATASLRFQRVPFDWRNNPAREKLAWGLVGLKNYKDIFIPSPESNEAKAFYRTLGVTALWTFVNVTLHYVLGLSFALLLERKVKGTRFYRVLLMVPWAVPAYVSAFAWRWLFNSQYGFFNVLLQKFGVSPVPWLSDSMWTFVAVSATNVWLGYPFVMIVLLAGLQAIPSEMYEAASIDGCSRWQSFRLVTLPLLRPVSMTVILLGTIWTFNMFNVIWLVQNGANTVEILATRAFRLFRDYHEYGSSAAYGVVILLVLLGFSLGYMRLLKHEEQLY